MAGRYSAELRTQAVEMVGDIRGEHESDWAAMSRVAELLGVGSPETVRKWCRQATVEAGPPSGGRADQSAELRRLKRENAELRRANEILKGAATGRR